MAKQTNPSPEGKCELCGETFTRRTATKHLQKCRAAHPLPQGTKTAAIYTLAVTSPDYPAFFLYVEISGDKTLVQLDNFLRDIWLECCGHLSAFFIGNYQYVSQLNPDISYPDEKTMNVKIASILEKGDVFGHEYDFGSTTALELKVTDIRETTEKPPAKPLLLMRNLPPEWKCAVCKKPATIVSSIEFGLSDDNVFCAACAKKNIDGYAHSPILNSPRSGVCGYGCDD